MQHLSWPRKNDWPDHDWSAWTDARLLRAKISSLRLNFQNSPLQRFVEQLYFDLEKAGLRFFQPEVYFGDEWFSPDRVPKISVPFFLAHPRLIRIEKEKMGWVEGGTPHSFAKLLRHEAGHAFDHAYKISREQEWQKLFGSSREKYETSMYRVLPFSRKFVRHLGDCYAQSHPDEDFAETFAVVVDPQSNWQKRYRDQPVFRKLEYVAETIAAHGGRFPLAEDGPRMCLASRLHETLAAYYRRRIKEAGAEHRFYFDTPLLQLHQTSASKKLLFPYLLQNKEQLLQGAGLNTTSYQYHVEKTFLHLVNRSRELNVSCPENEYFLQQKLISLLRYTVKIR